MKSSSSSWVKRNIDQMDGFQWQEKYGAFSVSKSVEPTVREYIRTQKEHHRRTTFKEELLALLERHDIEYDKRYVWT